MARRHIPERELELSFSRSGGSGGQNVNKVSTRVTLRWKWRESSILSDEEKTRVGKHTDFRSRSNSEGELVLHEDRERSQLANRRLAVEKLEQLLERALVRPRRRRPTRKPRSADRKRLEGKKQRSDRKKDRGWRPD